MKALAAALLLNLTGVQVSYHGGPVISKVRVVVVLWGTGTYVPEIARTSPSPSITDFYAKALDSPYIDWLAEYNTALSNRGTNQSIVRGEFIGRHTITPTVRKAVLSDADVQAELVHQIMIGALPAPRNASDYAETYYAVFLPREISALNQGQTFCSYHNAMSSPFGHLYYVVHPDMAALGARCGLNSFGLDTPFDVATYVASHELIESITDPLAGLAVTEGLPLSWYDANPGPDGKPIGEIGDICIHRDPAPTLPGTSYKVAPGWSNVAGQCVINSSLNDFDITTDKEAATLGSDGSASYNVQTRATAGHAESIALYAKHLPLGFTATFSPNPIAAGASSTLLIRAVQTPASAYVRFLLTGTSFSTNHSVAAELLTTTSPVLRSNNRATFQIGLPGSFEVVAFGTPTPSLTASGLPDGLAFFDEGNGRGIIRGAPALGQVGDHQVTITALNTFLESASSTLPLRVDKGTQTLRLKAMPKSASVNTSFTIEAIGGASRSAIALNASGACTIGESKVTTAATPGTCVVSASQPGDENYAPAPQEAIAIDVVSEKTGSCNAFEGPFSALSLLTFALALRLLLKTKRSSRR